jgi:phosphoribosyl 1,2-cyclic phosphodiesterase
MIRYAVLGSGSSANSYIIQYTQGSSSGIFAGEITNFADIPDPNNKITIVIDNGFSLKEFTRRAAELNFKLEDINFIFLTHDHSDHLKGVSMLSSRYNIPVVMGKDTCLKSEYSEKIFKTLIVENGKEYSYNNLNFSVFKTLHDSDGSVGYSFNIKGTIFTIITDTGIVTQEMEDHALVSDVLFLEANYCPDMLENGPYPWFLKKRIASDLGHLSNYDAVDFLKKIHNSDMKNKKRMTYLCHLSDKNNCSDKLESLIENNFENDFNYRICRKGEIVEGSPITII